MRNRSRPGLGVQAAAQEHGPFDPVPRLVPADLLAPALEAANDLFRSIVLGRYVESFHGQLVRLPAMMQMLGDLPR